MVATTKQVAKPGSPDPALWARYAPHLFSRTVQYQPDNDAIISESTGADVPGLLVNGASTVGYQYSQRGVRTAVTSSYGALLSNMTFDAFGSLRSTTLAGRGQTTVTSHFDTRRRLDHLRIERLAPNQLGQTQQSPPYTAGTQSPPTLQPLLALAENLGTSSTS